MKRKTTFLANQVETWAREVGSEEIMVASFTRAAAAEIGSRHLPLPERAVGTLHSFAYRSLGTRIEVAEAHVRDFNDAHPGHALSAGARPDLEEPVLDQRGRTDGDRLMSQLEMARARRVPEMLWPPGVANFAAVWNEWKLENDLLDFTDMIDFALRDTIAAPGSPSVGLFDEVQDFTPLELALVRHWAKQMDRLVLAGDDDQMIYAFKGATPDAFLDPPVPDDRKRVLRQSYRVPRAVHTVASRWIDQLARREPKAYEPRDAEGSVRLLSTASYRAPELLVTDVEGQVAAGREVMILATCSYMLDAAKAALRDRSLPFHNPYRRKRGDWNPLSQGTERRRTAVDRLLAFLRTQPSAWGDDARWYFGEDFRQWMSVLKSEGVLARGAKRKLDSIAGSVELDLDIFDSLWVDEETLAMAVAATQCGDIDWFAAHLLAAKRKPFEFPMQVAKQRGAAVLRERPRVVLGTIHSVKGAQADVVYLFPDLSIPAAQSFHNGDNRDEVIRQFYVGMTRACEELVVVEAATPFAVEAAALARGRL